MRRFLLLALAVGGWALRTPVVGQRAAADECSSSSRRAFVPAALAAALLPAAAAVAADAAPNPQDCMKDCVRECNVCHEARELISAPLPEFTTRL